MKRYATFSAIQFTRPRQERRIKRCSMSSQNYNPEKYVWQPKSDLSSAVYLVRAISSGQSKTVRVTYLKQIGGF